MWTVELKQFVENYYLYINEKYVIGLDYGTRLRKGGALIDTTNG